MKQAEDTKTVDMFEETKMQYNTLLEAQMGEYPDSVVLSDQQMFDALNTENAMATMWACNAFIYRSENPQGFFYACGKQLDGTYRYVGFRYGTEGHEYVSAFVGMGYKGTTK
jgi:hypothetical protein